MKFQSTPPVWGATGIVVPAILLEVISIHAPRVGGDIFGTNYYAFCEISIHAPRVGGDGLARLVRTFFRISIHAPRVGGDFETVYAKVDCAVISIHAPRVGGDRVSFRLPMHHCTFQSTPPVWGATSHGSASHLPPGHFNPRPPCGGRPDKAGSAGDQHRISIHAPRVGGDGGSYQECGQGYGFQSTPPVWGATTAGGSFTAVADISIHAPRVGGDGMQILVMTRWSTFQSTPPVWGATDQGGDASRGRDISIHAPRVGGDCRS